MNRFVDSIPAESYADIGGLPRTSFLFQAHPVHTVYAGPIFWEATHARAVMRAYRDFLPTALCRPQNRAVHGPVPEGLLLFESYSVLVCARPRLLNQCDSSLSEFAPFP